MTQQPAIEALAESRARWRQLVQMAADFIFETDAEGRLTFVWPPDPLGWPQASLIGHDPATLLTAEATGQAVTGFNPFRPSGPMRGRRALLRRHDGTTAAMRFVCGPVEGTEMTGGPSRAARGFAVDVSVEEAREAELAGALLRKETVNHIFRRMRRESLPQAMLQSGLEGLLDATGAAGGALLHGAPPIGDMQQTLDLGHGVAGGQAASAGPMPRILHQAGSGWPTLVALLPQRVMELSATRSAPWSQDIRLQGRAVLISAAQTHYSTLAALVLWRDAAGASWDEDERALVTSVSTLACTVLEHEQVQQEMARQARTDALTGLLTRHAFIEEIERRFDRLDREALTGTLMACNLDGFRAINTQNGYEQGDLLLRQTAMILRDAVRPTDLVARLGGDMFALWLDGADQFASAERADFLCRKAGETPALLGDPALPPLSVGLAPRAPRSFESIESLLRRAESAMRQAKKEGGCRWRVSIEEPLP